MADLFFKGTEYLSQDMENAVKLYKVAASKNLASAQKMLGILYANGQGVPKNIDKAKDWLSKAALNGDQSAQQTLKKIKMLVNNPPKQSNSK